MPAYDAARTLPHSMWSVLGQTHGAVELLVIDDCSSDGSWACIEQAAAIDPRVVALRMPRNGGVAAARNRGIEAASGDYLAFLDSDDRWHPRKLEIQLARMRESGARLSYTGYQRVGEDGQVLSTVRPPRSVSHADMLKSNRIGNLTALYDRVLGDARFRKVGHEDYVFWLEMVRRAGHAVRADDGEPLADYLVHANSLSSDKFRAARWQWRIYRDIECLDVARSAWYFAHYAGNAIAKRR
jgi:glycosyltransferase involved in cell wall biosynthesis